MSLPDYLEDLCEGSSIKTKSYLAKTLASRLLAKPAMLEKVAEVHLYITEGIFEASSMYDERAVWFQGDDWNRYFSTDYIRLMPHLEPMFAHTIKSPSIGSKSAAAFEGMLLGTTTGHYNVQVVRCSHIDWHDDKEVAKQTNCLPGVWLFCVSDNPLNMYLYKQDRNGGVSKTLLYKGLVVWLDDDLPHAVLPGEPVDVTHEELNGSPLSFVTFQKRSPEAAQHEHLDDLELKIRKREGE